MLIGSQANIKQINAFKKKITENPDNYIAQPIINLSTVPIFKKRNSRQDMLILALCLVGNNKLNLISGALTRVALKEGSLIVNSSQGGGVKDTWVLAE